jgi:hypothetical protein
VFIEIVFDDDSFTQVALEILVAVVNELEKRKWISFDYSKLFCVADYLFSIILDLSEVTKN